MQKIATITEMISKILNIIAHHFNVFKKKHKMIANA